MHHPIDNRRRHPSLRSRLAGAPGRSLLACALASCLMLAAPAALAQSTAATIRGVVSGNAGPSGNASVSATNLASGLVRKVQTAGDGNYTLAGLPPGTYRIDVDADGQTNTRNVTVAVGQTATLNLSTGGVAETAPGGQSATDIDKVTVTAAALAEVRTSENATYISTKQIEALPQGTRNFLAFADTVPGVQFVQASNGSASLRSGAQSSNGVNVYIDGVGQKNYVLAGGISGQDDTRGNPFPQSAIGEYKVITSNYKAEFDQLSSAAITAVTRSGTNEFHGDFFWDNTFEKWRAPTPAEDKAGVKTDSKEEQYGISFGGPIIQDKMHFFVAYEAKEYNTPFTIKPGEGVTAATLPAQFQSLIGGVNAPFKEDLYFAKLDLSVGENHYFELTGKYRDETELTGVDGISTVPFGTAKDNQDKRADLRYQYTGEGWINDAHLTFEDAAYNPRANAFGNGYVLTRGDNGSSGDKRVLNAGPGENFQNKSQKGWSFQDDLTFTDLQWHGNHTVKMGVKYKSIDISATEQIPYNPQFFYDIGGDLVSPYLVRFGAGLPGIANGSVESRNKQFGIYIQDDWEVNDKLTLNLGVRWDYETSDVYTDYRTPADVLNALNSQDPRAPAGQSYRQSLANGGIDLNKFISDGSQRSNFKDAIQPRLGFSYDLNADQRHVIYGGAGRAYDRNIFNNLQLETTKGTFPTYSYRFNQPGHPCTPGVGDCLAFNPGLMNREALEALVAANPNFGREVFLLSNDLKTPYSDQFSIGMRNAVTIGETEWQTDVGVSRIVSKDGFAFLLGNRNPDGSFYPPGAQWGAPFGAGIPGFGRALILGVNGIETRANSLLVKIDKPYTRESGWGVTVAYTFTDAEENRETGESFSLDHPSLAGFGWHDPKGVPRHRMVATGIYDGPWGLTFSGKLTLASPTGYYFVNCSQSPDGNDRACFTDQYKEDRTIGFKQLDLAVSKEFDTGAGFKFRIRGDVLNVTNARNYNQFDTFAGRLGAPNPNFGDHQDGIILPTRTFKLSMGFSW
ncbi:TonB-dependent receptor [Lysobacter enzymogenes]|nr:TonB-dependent receptor [Lysobacter enzymogenes]